MDAGNPDLSESSYTKHFRASEHEPFPKTELKTEEYLSPFSTGSVPRQFLCLSTTDFTCITGYMKSLNKSSLR